jgi:PIN domain nuclease of toxin-antitoxin system
MAFWAFSFVETTMGEPNRLELEITAVNSSGSVVAKFKSELAAVSAEAMKAAASAARASDQIFLSTTNVIERASAAAYRSLERLEARAALAGKSGSSKLLAQQETGIKSFGKDEVAINRYTAAMDKLITAEQRREQAARVRQEGTRAGQAVMQGEADFEAALRRMQSNNEALKKLETDRVRAMETPVQRVQRERSEFFSRGLSPSQKTAADHEFGLREATARQAELEVATQKMQENDAAIAKIRADRLRATETPTQRVQRERSDFLQRGLSPSQHAAAEQEFALREAIAREEETRKAGIAAGKAVLPGAAPFEEAFKKVRTRDAEILEIEDRARKASLSKPDYYRYEMESLLSRAGTTEAAAKRIRAGYADIIKAAEEDEKHGHGAGNQALRRIVLGAKDFFEGSTRGAVIEGVDVLVGTSGSGGILQSIGPKIAEVTGLGIVGTSVVAGFGAALVGLGIAGLESAKHLAETGEEIRNFSVRTGIAPERVQAFQFAATASGVGPDITERLTKGLAQAADDESPSGAAARRELKSVGVDLYDQFDRLKPTEQIIGELSDALNKLPEGLQRSAAGFEIFKRVGPDAIPFLKEFRANMIKSDEIGNTFSVADIEMLQKWDESIKAMEEEFKRFKLSVEIPLAIYGTLFLKGIMVGGKLLTGGGSETRELGEKLGFAIQDILGGEPEGPAPIKADADVPREMAAKMLGDSERRSYEAVKRQDPAYVLQQERKKLAELDKKVPRGSPDDVKAALNQYNLVKRLEQSGKGNTTVNKGLEDVIAARNQGLELDQQFAEIQLANKTGEMSARLETRKGLSTPEDIEERLRLASLVVDAKQNEEIGKRQKVVDTKTGREIDLSNTPDFKKFQAAEEELRPKRIRNEFEKILGKAGVDDEQYLKAQRDAYGKSWEEAFQRKQKVQMDIQEEGIRTEYTNRSRELDIAASINDRERDLALQQLGQVNAQTVKEKIAVEDQKLAIEQFYAERSLAIQIAKLERERTKAIDDIKGSANREGLSLGDPGVVADIAAQNKKYDQEVAAARQATGDKENIDFQKTQQDKTRIQIESAKTVYQNLKQQAGDLFDQMVFHTKSWGDFAKGIFKTAILTPIKDVFSSQVSAFFTQALTGQKVRFGELGNGEGAIGKLGSIYGRLGGGQPRFGEQTRPVSKLEAPNHLGDVSLVGNAVPVVIQNAAQVGQAHATAVNAGGPEALAARSAIESGIRFLGGWRLKPTPSTDSQGFDIQSTWKPILAAATNGGDDDIAAGLNDLIMSGARNNQLQGLATSTWSPVSGISPNGFPTMGEVSALGTPSGIFSGSDNPFGVPTPPPYVDQGVSGDGLGSGPSMLTKMFGESLQSSASGGGGRPGGLLGPIKSFLGIGNPADVHGTPPFVANGDGSPGSSGSGSGGMFSGLLGKIGGLFGGKGGGSPTGEIDPETGAPLGHGIPGSPNNASGETHAGIGGAAGAMLMAAGSSLVMDGLRRKPGVASAIETPAGAAMIGAKFGGMKGGIIGAGIGLMADGIHRGGWKGTFEDAGGGALIGSQLGGPVGAAIGAAVGFGVGMFRMMFETDRDHIKKLVKQVYGMDINNAMADQIAAIAKQKYGGQHDMAVRSPRCANCFVSMPKPRDKKARKTSSSPRQCIARAWWRRVASCSSKRSTTTATRMHTPARSEPIKASRHPRSRPMVLLPAVHPTSIQLVVNGQSASDLLSGQVVKTATPSFVQSQSLSASKSSIGRTSQQNLVLSPSALAK